MCGIFALFNNVNVFDRETVNKAFLNGVGRGPEYSEYKELSEKVEVGFHRLAINGLNSESNQPMEIDGITLICNGEIYNFRTLYDMLGVTPQTDSDCEVIIHLYKKFGIEYSLSLLDGYFSFVIFDGRIPSSPKVVIARDPYGVRPLYILGSGFKNNFKSHKELEEMQTETKTRNVSKNIIAVASDIKMLEPLLNNNGLLIYPVDEGCYLYSIEHFSPGKYYELNYIFTEFNGWEYDIVFQKKYNSHPFSPLESFFDGELITSMEYNEVYIKVFETFVNSVKKRVVGTTDRPVACLLSGGLDSSLVAALVSKFYNRPLETYSIGLAGGEDFKYARIVADHIGSKHTEIIVSEDDFFNAIPEVIRTIESYDTTTVRASVGNYLVSKYIAQHSSAKVIFNGDGSDELLGGYLYFHAAPDALSFDFEVKRLLNDIYYFDVLRSDKSISSNGLEPRTPFLDREWVTTYLGIPLKFRYNPGKIEKWLLRQSVHANDKSLLPPQVLWRTKEAFSDGVSSQNKSWYEIITERTTELMKNATIVPKIYKHLPPTTPEQLYYRTIFDSYYPNCENVIPYFWMPRFVNATDASARTLKLYANHINDNSEA